jgi:hypothetical protein
MRLLPVTMIAINAAGLASAQFTDFDGMLGQALQQNAALTASMQSTENGIIATNMNNPEVQRLYQAQGGGMSFQQFAYMYGATGGFTPGGIAAYNQTTREINARDAAAISDYRNHVNGLWAATNAERAQAFDRIADGRGHILSGTNNFAIPQTGQVQSLPWTVPTHTMTYDPSSGHAFYLDGQSQYWAHSGNGWWTPMQPAP